MMITTEYIVAGLLQEIAAGGGARAAAALEKVVGAS